MIRCSSCSKLFVALPLAGLFCAWLALPTASTASTAPAAAAAAVAAALPAATVADSYDIDNVHSSVIFRIQHMGVSYFYGRFNDLGGTFVFDDKDPTKSSVELTIETESIDTKNAKRDDHCRSPDFLNASEFPQIQFKSESVKKGKDGHLEVAGQLTLHGVTKPLTVDVENSGQAAGDKGKLAGFETVFTIKRSDFGMDQMLDNLGDEVRVFLAVEGRSR